MQETSQTVRNYNKISNDIKFLPKSIQRLQILKEIYQKPIDMRELHHTTKIDYSAISGNMHWLELEEHIFREKNKYYLSNAMRLHMTNLMELDVLMDILEEIFPILHNHAVKPIPLYSVENFHYLENVELLESDGLNVYKPYDYIEKSIKKAKYINAILPFSYNEFNDNFNKLIMKNINVNLVIPLSISKVLVKNLDTSQDSLNINLFDGDEMNHFLLICTDKRMMFGLFRNDGTFDQNRLLISEDEQSIDWANGLFETFKKENI